MICSKIIREISKDIFFKFLSQKYFSKRKMTKRIIIKGSKYICLTKKPSDVVKKSRSP